MQLTIPKLGVRQRRELLHWSIELVVVVVGVLLALLAAEWAQSQREARKHDETIGRINDLVTRTQATGAVRIATAPCLRERIAELEVALNTRSGPWRAMPLMSLPETFSENLVYPQVYLADGIDVPVELFEIADQNGALASLDARTRNEYDAMRQDLRWTADNWERGFEESFSLNILGVDGYLDDPARFDLRKTLAFMSFENHVAVIRTRSLADHANQAGLELNDADIELFRERIDFARSVHGECVLEIDPSTLAIKAQGQ